MTLDDVMKEFGILVERSAHESEELMRLRRARPVVWQADFIATHQPSPDYITEGCATPSAAAWTLLKSRFGIITHHLSAASQGIDPAEAGNWQAWHKGQGTQAKTELAAVVALARRIRGAG